MIRNYKFIFTVLALLALFGCNEIDINNMEDGDNLVRITLNAPEKINSKALSANTNSARGGIVNIDWTKYDLRYQLAVYDASGNTQVISPITQIVTDGYAPATFEFRLIPGQTYKLVSWADFVAEGTTTDLHYSTTNLKAITIIDAADAQLNDESRDAYFSVKNVSVNGPFNESLVLKRPFSKLRLVTTDWGYSSLPMPDNFKITYYNCTRFEGINIISGEAISADGNTVGKTLDNTGEQFTTNIAVSKSVKYYKTGIDLAANNRTLFVDYLFTNSEQIPIHFKIDMIDGTTLLASKDMTTNIPVQRNWLTTVQGNLLTTSGKVSISLDDNFTNEHILQWWEASGIIPKEPRLEGSTYHITSKEEFAWLPDNVAKVVGKLVVLDADIDMGGINWKPIFIADYNRYIFDGQGHTLRNFTVDGKYGALEGGTRAFIGIWGRFAGEMRNVKFENITINGYANDNVDVDVDGSPIEHNKDAAYFAGIVGHAGQNWPVFKNISVNNITIKASPNQRASSVGGLVGFIGSLSVLENCSVVNATLVGYETGGIVGKSLGGCRFENCTSRNIDLRIRPVIFKTTCVSGIVGKVDTGAITGGKATSFVGCTTMNVNFFNDSDGSISNYTPANSLYGGCPTNPELIVIQ